ncbi:MAG TPA: HXXEE domain-containing protein [Candidatus Angelobacter sp.]
MANTFPNVAPRRVTHEWTLWVVAVSCALHPIEEYFTAWQQWASQTLGIVMPTALFVFMNAALLVAAVFFARIGWRRPTLSLMIPAATLVNAVFFHILPTVVQHKVSPGVYTATLLYLPFSSWAFLGARRDGVPVRAMVAAFVAGAFLMLAVVLGARSLNGSLAQ